MADLLGDVQLLSNQTIAGYHPGLLSGVALAGANQPAEEDDGILTAEEVSTLDLSGVDLVVLSACETGLGEEAGGEGLLGLQRAFQAAGARTVVASLWKVDDAATQALMVEFYRNLWQGKLGKLESLRQAQLAMLRGKLKPQVDEPSPRPSPGVPGDGASRGVGPSKPLPKAGLASDSNHSPTADPYFWAGFVLSGDWR